MSFQYVFGNPTKKKHKKKKRTKNPQRVKAQLMLPSGRMLNKLTGVFPESLDVDKAEKYINTLKKSLNVLQKDISEAERLGEKAQVKKATALYNKGQRELNKTVAVLADMNDKYSSGLSEVKDLYSKGYATTTQLKRGKKWLTEKQIEDQAKKLADKQSLKAAKTALKLAKKNAPKAPKVAKVKKQKLANWLTEVPKYKKKIDLLEKRLSDAEFGQSMIEAAPEEFKKANPTKSKTKSKGNKMAKRKNKKKAKKALKGFVKIGKKGITKRRIKKMKKKKTVKFFMETKTKKGKKQVRKYAMRKTNPRRKNPIMAFAGGMTAPVVDWTGYDIAEIGTLGMGGLLYGATSTLFAKFLPKPYAMLKQIPVVGSSLPTLVLGVALHKLGEMQKIKMVSQLGQGLIGASIVGIGVSAAQQIPFLKSGLSGVDYTVGEGPDFGEGADFGQGPDFGTIPEGMGEIPAGLNGVDYTMGEAQMGGVDYTMGTDDDYSDYDGIPEGMGEGQMG